MRVCILLLAIALASCSSTRIIRSDAPRTELFPPGTYRHDVTIALPSGRENHFNGIVTIGAKEIRVVGLAIFGATAFRVVEDRANGKTDVSIYHDAMKKHEPELRKFYGLLRDLLLQPVDGYPAKLRLKETDIVFESYDGNKIPQRIVIRRPEFNVTIEVTGYEL